MRSVHDARFLALPFLFTLLLCCGACGGGGGGGGGPNGNPDPGDEVTRAILESCLPPALEGALAGLQDLDALLAGNGAAAGFAIVGGSILADENMLEMIIEYDANGDTTPDLQGPLRFLDDMGTQVNPYDSAQIDTLTTQGVAAFSTLLPLLVDGSQVVLDVSGAGMLRQARATWTYSSGVPGDTDGGFFYLDAPCAVNLDWTGQPWTGLVDTPFPTGTFAVSASDTTGVLDGTLVADQTATSQVDVSRDGGAVTQWNFDLQTGLATTR